MNQEIKDKVNGLAGMRVKSQPSTSNIRNNVLRHGNFTSGEIVALTTTGKQANGFGVPAITYIAEKNMERRLQRCLSNDADVKAFTWGHFNEARVFEKLGAEYILCSNETISHPSINFWSGSPDGIKNDPGKTVPDTKCPLTLKSFCQLVDPLYEGLTGMDAINKIRENHKDGEKFYWQLVSNSILSNSRFAELIVYMPYLSELPEIQLSAMGVPEDQLSKHYWIASAGEGELPYILDGGYYRDINICRFEVSETDKKLLTSCVINAGKLLNGHNPSGLKATYDREHGVTLVESFDVNQIPLIKI